MAEEAPAISSALHPHEQFVVECHRTLVQRHHAKPHSQRLFHSVQELEQTIRDYIDHHIANLKTFVWIKKAEDILEKDGRARKSLDKIPSA